jgi:hypothetical protein
MTLRKEGREVQPPNPPLNANETTEKELGSNTIARLSYNMDVILSRFFTLLNE